jgi:hypothetical protein
VDVEIAGLVVIVETEEAVVVAAGKTGTGSVGTG